MVGAGEEGDRISKRKQGDGDEGVLCEGISHLQDQGRGRERWITADGSMGAEGGTAED